VAALPEGVRRLHDAEPYPVRYSERLQALQRDVERATAASEVGPGVNGATR
jgi:hypothetical protein